MQLYKFEYTNKAVIYLWFKSQVEASWFAHNEGDHLLDYSLVV